MWVLEGTQSLLILFSLVKVKEQNFRFGQKQNTKVTFNHPHTHQQIVNTYLGLIKLRMVKQFNPPPQVHALSFCGKQLVSRENFNIMSSSRTLKYLVSSSNKRINHLSFLGVTIHQYNYLVKMKKTKRRMVNGDNISNFGTEVNQTYNHVNLNKGLLEPIIWLPPWAMKELDLSCVQDIMGSYLVVLQFVASKVT